MAALAPWSSIWWPLLVETAQKGGSTQADIINKVARGHTVGWPVDGGYLLLDRATDDALVIWVGVGEGVRNWMRNAERDVSEFAREIGCTKLRIEGRKGWRRILPHWQVVDAETLELEL